MYLLLLIAAATCFHGIPRIASRYSALICIKLHFKSIWAKLLLSRICYKGSLSNKLNQPQNMDFLLVHGNYSGVHGFLIPFHTILKVLPPGNWITSKIRLLFWLVIRLESWTRIDSMWAHMFNMFNVKMCYSYCTPVINTL